MARRPQPPRALGADGRRLWREMQGTLDPSYDFDARETAILAMACRQRDDVAALERAVRASGVVVAGSAGQPRLAGAVSELRQSRLAVARLLGDLQLPDADAEPRTAASRRAQHAAGVRWSEQARKAALRGRA